MLVFPSLRSEALVQLPSGYEIASRLAEVRTISDKSYSYVDTAYRHKLWRLQYQCLTDSERAVLEDFFRQTGGRLRTFTFLSPFENLLRYTLMNTGTWNFDSQLVVSVGGQDPLGGDSALLVSNPSAVSAELRQCINAPAWFRYTFSGYSRNATASALQLFVRSNNLEATKCARRSSDWTRTGLTVSSLSTTATLEVGFKIPPLTEASLHGPQLEVAGTATEYKAAQERSGVYPECRFLNDTLTWRSESVDNHSTEIEIISRI